MATTPKKYGELIVFEGIDGTGKSTQIKTLADYLDSLGHRTVTGYEPTHGIWGKRLRDSMTAGRLSHEEEIDLFLKDRRDNVENFILPNLDKGLFVLLDRYYFSMMAYQGARGHDSCELRTLNEKFAPLPSLVIWLDIPVETALLRVGERGKANEFEQADQLQKCRDIFSSIPDNWFVRVDASGSVEDVAQKVRSVVDNHFSL